MVKRHGILIIDLTIFFLFILAPLFTYASASPISYTRPVAGRSLLQSDNASKALSSRDDETVRVDPLDHFKKYRGGYDITNKHYWSSLIFTGVYGYAIGLVWLLCGVTYVGFLLVSRLLSRKTKEKLKRRLACSKQCYLWPLLLTIFLTILALTASGVSLGGSAKFYSRAQKVVKIIINTADEASKTIYKTTDAMKGMSDNLGSSAFRNETTSDGASIFLTSTSQRLDNEAADIQRQARKNRRIIDKGLKIVYAIATVTVSLTLIVVIFLLVCGVLRFQRGLNLLIIFCWFLTALCWLFFGVFYFLEKFSGDTCTALNSFQQNPQNNSLSAILPCDELLSAKPILSDVSSGIYNLVSEVNANISTLQATTFPNIVYVCNPFSGPPDFLYQPNNCPTNTIKIGDIPQILKVFTCSDGVNTTCKAGEFISRDDYRRVEAYTTSIQEILNAYPGMENLVECESVKDAFSEILTNHCKPLKRYARMAWIGTLSLSIILMPLVLLWMAKARHEGVFHSSDASSVRPQCARNTSSKSTMDTMI